MSDMITKSYNSIKELPSEVRSSFDERDQQKWMDAYNKASENKEPEQAKVDAWMSMVDAPSSLAVETWGSVEVRDADGELVPVKTIEEYADKFIENGGLMHDSHSNVPVGTVWDYEVRKHPETGQDGIVFYFNIYRDGEVFERARDDILSGRKNAVSIGAEAPRGGYKCDDRGCYVERDVTDLYELSICETPANPEAYFINVGKDIAKAKTPIEGEVFRIGIKDVVVHQDYTTCPLQKCKHDLIMQGFEDVHIDDDGKIIAKSKKNEFNLFKAIKSMDYPFRYDLKKEQFEIMPDYGVEQAIEEAVENGWAHEDQIGHICLTKEIPKEVFMDWYDRGFITKIGDFYCLKADDVAKDVVTKSGYQRPNGEQLYEMLSSIDTTNDGPWMAFCEKLTEITDEAMQRFNLDPVYEDIVRGFFYDAPGDTDNYLNDASDLQYMIDTKVLGKSAKKKVKKDGGAMGVGDAGATNAVYGAKPTSLTNPDKKYGKKKKTKKEFTDDGNIHAVGSRQAKKSYGNFFDAVENFIVDSPEGVYYNDILDEFSDALDEDDILDALEQICNDGAIIYDDRTERFKVGKKVRKSFAIFNPDDEIEVFDGKELVFDKKEDAEYVLASDEFPDGWYCTEIGDDKKPLFKNVKKSVNSIEKKCPKGKWKDKKTGECISVEEWKSKYGNSSGTEQSAEQPKEKKPSEDKADDGVTDFKRNLWVINDFMSRGDFTHAEFRDLPQKIQSNASKGNYYRALNDWQELRSRLGYYLKNSEKKEEILESFSKIKDYLMPFVEQKEKEDKQKLKAGEKEHPEWTKEEKKKNRVKNFFKDRELDDNEIPYMTSNGTPIIYDKKSGDIYMWTKKEYNYKGNREPDTLAYHWSEIPQGTNVYLKTREDLSGIE